MWTKMLAALAFAGAIALGGRFGTQWVSGSIKPVAPSDLGPTFSEIQAQIPGHDVRPALGNEPWAKAERHSRQVRSQARAQALTALEAVTRLSCHARERAGAISALSYYLEQRGMQERGYSASWGEAGARFIAQAWATPDDRRIEEMTQVSFRAGEFRLRDFAANKRDQLQKLIGDQKRIESRCG